MSTVNKACFSENSQRITLFLSICILFISTAVFIRTELVHRQECSEKVSIEEFENLKRIVVSLNENYGISPGQESRGPPKSCAAWYKAGERRSGVYNIDPDGRGPFDVYCDQTTAGGGWTVIQKRQDGSVDFYRGWADYKKGFGNLEGEFWLGLDKIHRLTQARGNKLRIELEWRGETALAEYAYFGVSNDISKYRLLSLGTYSGTAGDSFSRHSGAAFTTKDSNNDNFPRNCAIAYRGAWWYSTYCGYSNLNGPYHKSGVKSIIDQGIVWAAWKGWRVSAQRTEMKLRPAVSYTPVN